MSIPITVPRLGWSMDEGTFLGWLKKDGERVETGEPLFTLENEKAAQDIESPDSGILRIPADAPQAGTVVEVGAVLGYLVADSTSGVPDTAPPPPSATPESPPLPSSVESPAPPPPKPTVAEAALRVPSIAISPRARRRAKELGVDWNRLRGSGRTGRIIEADVFEAASSRFGSPAPGWSTMRQTIARKTADSFAHVPHFYLRTEVDVEALIELRNGLLPEVERGVGVRLTLTDLLLRAQGLALRDCPYANATWEAGRLPSCDVGLVVGLDDGLLVPIVRAVDAGDLAALAKQRAGLTEAARAGRLTAEAMQGGATSLSNLGATCVDEFTAVIAPPQSSMLAVGRAVPRAFVVGRELTVRTTLRLCLSVDHRVMDGGAAAKFLGRMVELVEHPEKLTGE